MCSIGALLLYPDYDASMVRKLVVSLLKEMVVRGHDAAGIAVVYNDGKVWLRKAPVSGTRFANIIDKIKDWETDAKVMLLHTRAATQGSPRVNENNHPLWKLVNDELMYILVHNGVVNGSKVEREREVDSDAILQAIAKECRENGVSTSCVSKALDHVSGSMAIAVTDTKTKKLVLYRNTNPTYCALITSIGLVCVSTAEIFRSATKGLVDGNNIVEQGYTTATKIYELNDPDDALRLRDIFTGTYGYYYTKYGKYYGYGGFYSPT